MNPLYNLPVPHTARDSYQGDNHQSSSTFTGPALKNCALFTKEAGEVTFSPKYSLLVNGLKSMCASDNGGMMSGFENMMGTLMVMASPIYGVGRFGVGVPVTILAAGATGAAAVLWLGEKAVRSVSQIKLPSLPENQTKKLMQEFVERMHTVLKEMKVDHQTIRQFKAHPETLIGIAALCVAFLSREAGEGTLLHQGLEITKNEVKDKKRRNYFDAILIIKENILDLELEKKNERAWKNLMAAIDSANDDSETYILSIIELTANLGETVAADPEFKEAWEASLN